MIAAAVTNINPMTDSLPRPGHSRPVHSNQSTVHPGLAKLVRRHLDSPHRAPVAVHNQRAFDQLGERLGSAPLVLDAFCGTGMSTAILAARHPDHLVVGIDKSARRLGRHRRADADNYLLLRADCEAIWQLLVAAGHRAAYHYLFYPNPWPKSTQLKRRVHGHPAFPLLLELGGRLELRSNWQVYVEEFGSAMHLAGQSGYVCLVPAGEEPLSLHEKKYRESAHELWSYSAAIPP